MKIIKIYGGLGNQMFQYAFAKNMEKLTGDKVFIDTEWGNRNTIHNGYELEKLFPVNMEKAKKQDIERLSTQPDSLKNKIRKKYFTKKTHYIDRSFKFKPEVFEFKGDLYYEGYWQSEKFFFESKGEIKKAFTFPEITGTENKNLIKTIDEKTAAIHIRRGDYLKEKLLYVCNLDYYNKSIDKLVNEYNIHKLLVFSNDIQWCKENLKKEKLEIKYCNWNTGLDSWKDMALISLCPYNIISNSSFSWWAAYLNKNHGKKILCPEIWALKNKNPLSYYKFDFSDVIPDEWERIFFFDKSIKLR